MQGYMSDLNLSFKGNTDGLVDYHFCYCLGFAAGLDSSQDGGFNLNES